MYACFLSVQPHRSELPSRNRYPITFCRCGCACGHALRGHRIKRDARAWHDIGLGGCGGDSGERGAAARAAVAAQQFIFWSTDVDRRWIHPPPSPSSPSTTIPPPLLLPGRRPVAAASAVLMSIVAFELRVSILHHPSPQLAEVAFHPNLGDASWPRRSRRSALGPASVGG